jgi:hypothetical protein
MSAIRNDKKFAPHVKKEGKAIGAELGEEELKQVVGGSFGRIEWTYWPQKL